MRVSYVSAVVCMLNTARLSPFPTRSNKPHSTLSSLRISRPAKMNKKESIYDRLIRDLLRVYMIVE